MRISSIKQQVKRAERYSVFVDDKYSFSLSELGLINSGLHVGQEIDKEELEGLKDTALYDKFYNNVLNLLARRPRSEWEIHDYLKRKDSPAPLIEKILNKLSKNGYVNDKEFARIWIENRRLLRPTSRRKLIAELKQKRVSQEAITEAIGQDETDETQVLKDLIAKKRKIARYQDDQKLMRYLAGQGFNFDNIKSALGSQD